MIKLLLFSSIFQHFTVANGILNSSQQNDKLCDLKNLVKDAKVASHTLENI